ncbi:hypothetical protein [Streptomyces sp. CHB9.2]|uniref:hypothetical protein n=1 Tax=Streptomyces sp. CHB9.2 TaxID=2841670 RepID=UPI0020960A77|nr:hypothetical protein [Streptomyces sp. CHB9.2]MCO6704713.1 hypothetical protein [Streptomyces sp. CHB9.2]
MLEQKHHTAAYKIFHYFVECLIPQMYLYSQEYVQKFGLYSSGDSDVDAAAYQNLVKVNLTVHQMAGYAEQGASIALVNPDESKQIYGWILEHINDWQDEVNRDPGLRDQVPVNDLRILEEFAALIYPMARQHVQTEVSTSRLFRSLDRLSRRAVRRDMTTPAEVQQNIPMEHSMMVEGLADQLIRRGAQV